MRSLRNSRQYGYGFASHFKGDYTSVVAYVEKMQAAIAADELIAESAFHEAVRLRHPAGLTALTTHGISHIELRMLDLDPTVTTGIRSDTLLLVQLLAFYFMVTPKLAATELTAATQQNDQVALEHPLATSSQQQAGLDLLAQLQELVITAELPPIYRSVVVQAAEKLCRPQLTLAGRLLPRIQQDSLLAYGLQQARNFQLRAQLNSSPVYRDFQNEPRPSLKKLQQVLFDQYQGLPHLNPQEQSVVS